MAQEKEATTKPAAVAFYRTTRQEKSSPTILRTQSFVLNGDTKPKTREQRIARLIWPIFTMTIVSHFDFVRLCDDDREPKVRSTERMIRT
jgi:hypothetical protein